MPESFSGGTTGYTFSGTGVGGAFSLFSSLANANNGFYNVQHTASNNDAQVVTPNVTTVSAFSFYIKKGRTYYGFFLWVPAYVVCGKCPCHARCKERPFGSFF